MSEILRQLHADHVNMAKLLDVLERQLDHIHDIEPTDFVLMADLMHYMTHYPAVIHHPREDLVFERLKARDASAAEVVEDLAREHIRLADVSEEFLASLRRALNEQVVSRGELEAQGRTFARLLRAHMSKEEGHAFPLARQALDEQDWESADAAMHIIDDPVFGPVVEDEYRSLYAYLMQDRE